MTLYDVQAFLRWLKDASDDELEQRRADLAAFMKTIRSADTRGTARLYLRQIEDEILSRHVLGKK